MLNDHPHVNPDTCERVRSAIIELGYVPSSHARALKGKPNNSVALIVSDVSNPFFAALTRGVEDVAEEHGFSLILCNADRGKAKQRRYLERLLAHGIKGVIVAPAMDTLSDLKSLAERGVDLVVVDWRYPLPEADNVYTDSIGGARQLTEHLLELGHQRIGIISGPPGDVTAEDRVAGYRLALADAGLEPNPDYIFFGRFDAPSGSANCTRLLSLDPRPTALVTGNNRIAVGAYQAILAHGLQVPRDVALASFDEAPFDAALATTLTAMVQPDYEMGRTAAQLLIERLRGQRSRGDRREVVFQARLVVRSSCGSKPAVPAAHRLS
mgnify:CR=1 FL=1